MKRLVALILPISIAAALSTAVLFTALNVAQAAPPDQATAVPAPNVDAVASPSTLPPAPDVASPRADVAVARVLAIETTNPAATVITAFAIMAPQRPLPLVLAGWSTSPLVNPYDDSVPIAVKRWAGRRPPRFTC